MRVRVPPAGTIRLGSVLCVMVKRTWASIRFVTVTVEVGIVAGVVGKRKALMSGQNRMPPATSRTNTTATTGNFSLLRKGSSKILYLRGRSESPSKALKTSCRPLLNLFPRRSMYCILASAIGTLQFSQRTGMIFSPRLMA